MSRQSGADHILGLRYSNRTYVCKNVLHSYYKCRTRICDGIRPVEYSGVPRIFDGFGTPFKIKIQAHPTLLESSLVSSRIHLQIG